MFQGFRFEGQVIFGDSTSIKSWLLKSVFSFYIDIHFSSSTNEGHSLDTQFCIHDLIKENDLNDQSMNPKNHNCITCINLFLHYMHHFVFALHALTVATVILVFKSNYQIERYRIIKFARSTCIMSRQNQPHMINLN